MRFSFVMQRQAGTICRGDVVEVFDCAEPQGNGIMSVLEIEDMAAGKLVLAGRDGFCMSVTLGDEHRAPSQDVNTDKPTTLH